ncbi:MAG: three-Cys-motif partner protein TcmP [Oscillospiraceae bacterium]|nr:three-Cys-motif partner protein TcmP [Oscillospiraceae bacterium]
MSKKNDDFFKEKKIWSTVKDNLLGCYLQPYFSKILLTGKPIIYIDCFAGKGKFEDGNPGSPIIALDIIKERLDVTTAKSPYVEANFIDLNYAEDLRTNLSKYSNIRIISGKFEDNILNLLKSKNGCNVFLYIDPYGIKALQSSFFDDFSNGQFNTIELLINLNSFGFIREACRAMGVKFKEDDVLKDIIEYDSTKLDSSDKSILELNEIAGGDYWQAIIHDYKSNIINGYEAEGKFVDLYCQRMMKSYKYVLNLPLRLKEGQQPKYRMIHATQHQAGCLLMVDNMYCRWEAMREIQTGGQLSFFETNVKEEICDTDTLTDDVVEHFSQYSRSISISEAMASFFVKYGVIASTKNVRDILKELEKQNRIVIKRTPSLTPQGKPTKFMEEKKGQSVIVRWIK